MRAWLQHSPGFSVTEGSNLDRVKNSSSEVWVTTIRDPIQRLWSSFKYEGRWTLRTQNYTRPAQSFEAWLNRTMSHTCTRKTWQCAENCFTRWFSGCSSGPVENAYAAAVAGLAQFDVVVDVAQLRSPKYVARLEECLGRRNYKRRMPYHAEHAAAGNELYPATPITPIQMDLLNAANSVDYALLAPYTGKPPC